MSAVGTTLVISQNFDALALARPPSDLTIKYFYQHIYN